MPPRHKSASVTPFALRLKAAGDDPLLALCAEWQSLHQRTDARDDRPGLAQALAALDAGDILVIWKLDRLGRSLRHLVETVASLRDRNIGFRVLTGGIDTTSAAG